jgi:hypothetical protein
MATERPKPVAQQPIFAFRWRKRRAFFRFLFNGLASVTSLAAAGALGLVSVRDIVDERLIQVGTVVALGACALFAVRGLLSLLAALLRPSVDAEFFKQGFTWDIGRQKHRYPYSAVRNYREGARTLRFLGLPLRRIGANTLTMRDKTVFRITRSLTKPAAFDATVGPILNDLMGQRIAKGLREDQTIKLADDLLLNKRGIKVGKHPVSWARLDVLRKGSQVVFKQREKSGKFKTIWTIPAHRIDNLGGFLEVTAATLNNHQPERTDLKTGELSASTQS